MSDYRAKFYTGGTWSLCTSNIVSLTYQTPVRDATQTKERCCTPGGTARNSLHT
ncbi:Hypothetical predicted protein, partial [Pelobates cultripes]